jgi:DNA-binding LacI/PurR family transcriptional regulator
LDVRIAVATQSFGAGFTGLMYAQLRRNVVPEQSIVECAIVLRDDAAFVRSRLLRLLAEEPRPAALVGICIRPDAETVAAFRQAGAPVVLVDEEQEGASTVSSDNFAGGYAAGQHLVGTGRRSLAVVAGQMYANGGYNALQRVKGFAKALSEHHLDFPLEDVIQVVDYSRREGVSALGTLLHARPDLDAVFCAAGDVCASGLLATARDRRLKVPDRLAVVGYDDNPVASLSNPPLTTVRQPVDEIAAEAWRLATRLGSEVLAKPKRVLFEPKLVQRVSA